MIYGYSKKMKQNEITKKVFVRAAGLGLLFLIMTSAVMATAGPAASADASSAVPQNYIAGASVLPGMLIEPGETANTVVPASPKDISKVLGVVVPASAADITLTPASGSGQQVLVAATGQYNVLVSSQNGPIKAGDYLTLSALPGIAMKATAKQTEVVGQATDGFNGKSGVIDTTDLKSTLGNKTTASIGRVSANVRVTANPLYKNDNNVPGFLNKAANSIANKQVNPVRIYLSIGVLLATFFITGGMFYGGIRGGITAIGRNPLAKKAISRGLIQAVVMGLVVLAAGIFAVYVILI